MKILIVSDTHGRLDNLKEAIEKVQDFDHLIHCGDVEGQEETVEDLAGVPCTIVRGNNDWDTDLPNNRVVDFGPYRLFVTHGHRYGVSYGTEELKEEAKARGCNVAVFGHIHKPLTDERDPEVTVINPGSLTFPRQGNRLPSYVVMEITEKGQALYTKNYIGEDRRNKGKDRLFGWF